MLQNNFVNILWKIEIYNAKIFCKISKRKKGKYDFFLQDFASSAVELNREI